MLDWCFNSSDIDAGEEMNEVVDVTPKFCGKHVIAATFNSRQVTGITGEVDMEVDE